MPPAIVDMCTGRPDGRMAGWLLIIVNVRCRNPHNDTRPNDEPDADQESSDQRSIGQDTVGLGWVGVS